MCSDPLHPSCVFWCFIWSIRGKHWSPLDILLMIKNQLQFPTYSNYYVFWVASVQKKPCRWGFYCVLQSVVPRWPSECWISFESLERPLKRQIWMETAEKELIVYHSEVSQFIWVYNHFLWYTISLYCMSLASFCSWCVYQHFSCSWKCCTTLTHSHPFGLA